MAKYEQAEEEKLELLHEVLHEHHQRLVGAGVTLALLNAFAPKDKYGDPKGPALKHHGVPALGRAKIISLEYRAMDVSDAQIIIDADSWEEMTNAERRALLDHELTHIEVMIEDGAVLKDDLGRPRLKIRPHDWEFGWFDEVANRHGIASQERLQARRFHKAVGQLYLDFGGAKVEVIQPTMEDTEA